MNQYTSSYAQAIIRPVDFFKTIDLGYSSQSLVLVTILGIVSGLNRYVFGATADEWWSGNAVMIFAGVLRVLLPVVGILIYTFLWAAVLNWTASLFRAGDDGVIIRMALPFTYIPGIFTLIITLFIRDSNIKLYVMALGWMWGLALMVIMIAAIKKISFLKSFIVAVLAPSIILLPVGLVYLIFTIVKS